MEIIKHTITFLEVKISYRLFDWLDEDDSFETQMSPEDFKSFKKSMKAYLEKWFDDEWEDRPNVTKQEIRAELTEVLSVRVNKSVEHYTFTY